MSKPAKTRLFHITAMENLAAIVTAGCLWAKNSAPMRGGAYTNIAHQSIQGRRSEKSVTAGRGGVIHDYVPFYFAPRSPMLFALHNNQVVGYSAGQAGIVTLETTVARAIAHDPHGFVFYDMNASLQYSTAYRDLCKTVCTGELRRCALLGGSPISLICLASCVADALHFIPFAYFCKGLLP